MWGRSRIGCTIQHFPLIRSEKAIPYLLSFEERHRAMSWMQRRKRLFNIDIETCENCGGQVKVTALARPAHTAYLFPQERAPPA
ncbi:hypothetical protein D1BOALGB6SA_9075 [Olavius sp. associated proteobacterium Delta 1]|nr:hypothetical protein D1BOALGB6SA_9075 [Olavius sp. associated proteobacterium Delta 1]